MKKFIDFIKLHVLFYPTSLNLGYLWSFGSLSGFSLFFQLISGFLLAIQYNADSFVTFENMEHIMRDVKYGWLIRYFHSNTASMFFVCMYVHVFRGVFFKSFIKPRNEVWISGILILLVSIVVAFIGYVLPWGQMSFWGATVITNPLTVIPWIGKEITISLWGSFSISGVTLLRFYALHFILAIVLVMIVLYHLTVLHEIGSSISLAIEIVKEKTAFAKLFISKDLFVLNIFLTVLCVLMFFCPNKLGHPDNYMKANALVTPTHIVPEWYSLSYYAILRSVENKVLGVFTMLSSIVVLAWIGSLKKLIKIDFLNFYNINFFFWIFIISTTTLGFVGSLPAEFPYINYGIFFTFIYFFNFTLFYFYLKYFDNFIIESLLPFYKNFSIKTKYNNLKSNFKVFLTVITAPEMYIKENIIDLHNDIIVIFIFMIVLIFSILFMIIINFGNKSHTTSCWDSREFYRKTLAVLWTIVPIIFLIVTAFPMMVGMLHTPNLTVDEYYNKSNKYDKWYFAYKWSSLKESFLERAKSIIFGDGGSNPNSNSKSPKFDNVNENFDNVSKWAKLDACRSNYELLLNIKKDIGIIGKDFKSKSDLIIKDQSDFLYKQIWTYVWYIAFYRSTYDIGYMDIISKCYDSNLDEDWEKLGKLLSISAKKKDCSYADEMRELFFYKECETNVKTFHERFNVLKNKTYASKDDLLTSLKIKIANQNPTDKVSFDRTYSTLISNLLKDIEHISVLNSKEMKQSIENELTIKRIYASMRKVEWVLFNLKSAGWTIFVIEIILFINRNNPWK